MKNIIRNFRKFSLVVILGLLFNSCSKEDETKSNVDTKSSNLQLRTGKYSGAEILEGLFFFKNDIADGIPQLVQIKSQIKNYNNYLVVSNSMDELSKLSIDFINQRYPNYLNELQTAVYSGNLFLIGEKLQQTAKYIEQAGLSSVKYQSAFLTSDKIYDNPALRAQIAALDLSTPAGMTSLNQIVSSQSVVTANNSNGRCVAVAGAVAAVYVGVVAVSIVVAAYSVYFRVVYWGGGSCRRACSPLQQANIYLANGGVQLERDVLISQIGTFFKP
jgi:hypothetical protein